MVVQVHKEVKNKGLQCHFGSREWLFWSSSVFVIHNSVCLLQERAAVKRAEEDAMAAAL